MHSFGFAAAIILYGISCHGSPFEVDEKLIGWKGEIHSRPNIAGKPVQFDDREGCPEAGDTSHSSLELQKPKRLWIYEYPPKPQGPRYTHMAMITQLPNGTLLAAWQAAKTLEGTSDQHIVISSSSDGEGLVWSPPSPVPGIADGRRPLWGPSFLVDAANGALWMFYSQSSGDCKGGPMEFAPGGDIKAVRHDLHTHQWSSPQKLLSIEADGGIPKVTANKAIELSTGEFVLPFWRENALLGSFQGCKRLRGHEGAGVLISTNRGASWRSHGHLSLKGSWLIENAVVELRSGDLMMAFRTRSQRIYAAYSSTKGRTWGEAKPLADLKNPNSKIDLMTVQPGGELALVYNDHINPSKDKRLSELGCIKCRTYLRVALSRDEGRSWKVLADVEDEVDTYLRIHYPTLQQVGCKLLVAYSKFNKLPPRGGSLPQEGIRLAHVSLVP